MNHEMTVDTALATSPGAVAGRLHAVSSVDGPPWAGSGRGPCDERLRELC